MKVDLTREEIEAVIEIVNNTYLVPDVAERAVKRMKQALTVDDNVQFELNSLNERIERLEREKEERDREQFNSDAERAWQGE